MVKRILIICILLFVGYEVILAQDTYVVEQFGRNLSVWASKTQTFSALKSLESLRSKKPEFLIASKLMQDLAAQNGLTKAETYKWNNFISCMQKEIDKGVSIRLSDVKDIPASMIPVAYRDKKNLNFVSCEMKISGAINLTETDLFVLVNGKVAKIQEYEVVEGKGGRRTLRIDLSDLDLDEDTESIGLTYNYSKSFPVGFSVAYTKWKFLISLDMGFNFDKDFYTTQKIEFNNLMDYKITRGEYDPKFYLTLTPAFYLKYFSVGYGFGFLSMRGSEYEETFKGSVDENGNTLVTSGSNKTDGAEMVKFMMRPNVRGFIPCGNDVFVTLSCSYNWIPGYKKKSGIDFGIGIQCLID